MFYVQINKNWVQCILFQVFSKRYFSCTTPLKKLLLKIASSFLGLNTSFNINCFYFCSGIVSFETLWQFGFIAISDAFPILFTEGMIDRVMVLKQYMHGQVRIQLLCFAVRSCWNGPDVSCERKMKHVSALADVSSLFCRPACGRPFINFLWKRLF